MSLDQLRALPIPSILEHSAAVFLWATIPFGRDPYDLLVDGWRIKYKTEWFWHKTGRKGTGYWTRGCVEKLLVGVRGDVKAWRSNLDNWIDAEEPYVVEETPSRIHSRKPAVFRQMIEQLTPGAKRVELFATERVPGWASFGLALDLTHNFHDPAFWEDLRAREDVPIPAPEGRPLLDVFADDDGPAVTLTDSD